MYYKFYKQKSEKLAIILQSTSILTMLYNILGFKPVTTIFIIKKIKIVKNVLNRKFGPLIPFLWAKL